MTLTSRTGRAAAKSTVHRLLARLIELDAVEHHGAGYKLSLRLLQLGATTPAASLRDRALPTWPACTLTGETVQLACYGSSTSYTWRSSRAPTHPSCCPGSVVGCPQLHRDRQGAAGLGGLDDLAALLPSPMPMLTPTSVSDVNA